MIGHSIVRMSAPASSTPSSCSLPWPTPGYRDCLSRLEYPAPVRPPCGDCRPHVGIILQQDWRCLANMLVKADLRLLGVLGPSFAFPTRPQQEWSNSSVSRPCRVRYLVYIKPSIFANVAVPCCVNTIVALIQSHTFQANSVV